jgi:hypothetical protein
MASNEDDPFLRELESPDDAQIYAEKIEACRAELTNRFYPAYRNASARGLVMAFFDLKYYDVYDGFDVFDLEDWQILTILQDRLLNDLHAHERHWPITPAKFFPEPFNYLADL